eukprot:TRINITY_DN779995_c0_g1_i1.p1 TRINITY_DN779995_c0_g1~~TRINITY_DN779995_c0_g1_i1.p1  ORF type:complete len:271 (-),score=82.74 TRINITY_DN779995_c0_g1_i1:59-799(-)
MEVVIGDYKANLTFESHIEPAIIEKVQQSEKFKEWVDLVSKDKALEIKGIHIQSVDMFGAKNVGFIKFKTQATVDGQRIPGIVFMRGGAVAILMILKCGEEKFALMTAQPRVPLGSSSFLEVPAGMIDGEGCVKGVAVKEIQEETGFEIKSEELFDLSGFAHGHLAYNKGMVPSAGGCDEFIRLFSWEQEVSPEKLAELQGKCTGLRDHGEMITLEVVPLENLWRSTPDAKTLSALFLYEKYNNAK